MEAVEALNLLIKKVSDILKDSNCVREIYRVLAYLEKLVEDHLHVGQVEVAGHDEAAGAPVVLAGDGVNVIDIVVPVGAVAQVSEPHIAWVLADFGVDAVKDLFYRVGRVGALTVDITRPRLRAYAYPCQACPVLAAVMLLLHHEVHLAQAVIP